MKVSAIFAAAAVSALLASPAAAGTINQGQWFSHLFQTNIDSPPFAGANLIDAQTANSPWSAWHAVGASVGDNGTASMTEGASFTLKGAVTKDCAFYTGSLSSQTLDFGTLGIYASDNTGPAAAFDMVAPANVTIYTNLAGCNTANSVTVTKSNVDGLVNVATGGYDSNVFQANLPYSVEAKYTAADQGDVAVGSTQTLSVASTALSATRSHGAWKSPFSLAVNIPVPSKSLLAGNYEGRVNVDIVAF